MFTLEVYETTTVEWVLLVYLAIGHPEFKQSRAEPIFGANSLLIGSVLSSNIVAPNTPLSSNYLLMERWQIALS